MLVKRELIKVDKNGSRHYSETHKCFKCNGTGFISYYHYHDSGRCYDCDGTGYVTQVVVERTAEYQAKLDARRMARQAKRDAEAKANWFAKNGFNEDGISYLFLDDVYSRKDEIKALGAKYHSYLGWHIDHSIEGFNLLPINITDVASESNDGWSISAHICDVPKMKRDALHKLSNTKHSEYVGEIGKRITIQVTYLHSCSFKRRSFTGFGTETVYIHKFADADGNLIVWKTPAFLYRNGEDVNKGDSLIISATIKEHSTYNDDKQTIVTRLTVKG